MPRLAQIVGIVDVFDALTRPRPYRGALSPDEAVRHLLWKSRAAGCRHGMWKRSWTCCRERAAGRSTDNCCGTLLGYMAELE